MKKKKMKELLQKLGTLMALAILLDQKRGKKVDADPEKMGCAGCPNSKNCNGEGECE